MLGRIMMFPLRRRQQRASKSRNGLERDAFIKEISSNQYEQELAADVWDHLLTLVHTESFLPHPDDNLLDVYGIADEEITEDIIGQILDHRKVKIPHSKIGENFKDEVNSPRRIVKFISFVKAESDNSLRDI